MLNTSLTSCLSGALAAASLYACSPDGGDEPRRSLSEGNGASELDPIAGSPGNATPGPGVIPTEPGDDLIVTEPPTEPTDNTLAPGEECEGVVEMAEPRFQPQDVVIVIDSSGSMDDEMQEIEARINETLAAVLEANGIDYRVIMIARYGNSEDRADTALGICIASPLGGHDCSSPQYLIPEDEDDENSVGGTQEGTQPLSNGDRFFHHSEYIDSHNALCQVLERFHTAGIATEHGPEFATGWQASAREEAFKNFLMFTDDRAACEYRDVEIRAGKDSGTWEAAIASGEALTASLLPAQTFDEQLLNLSPLHFGTTEDRNYRIYSVVGLAEQVMPLSPYTPNVELVSNLCTGNANEVVSPGLVYQQLSVLTGGLRYPICQNRNFDAIFNAVAARVTENAKLSCEWEIPAVPAGQSFDRDRVNVSVSLDGAAPLDLFRVDEGACGDQEAWFYDRPVNPTRVLACPATCNKLENVVETGQVEIQFGCQTRTPIVR